MSLIAEAASGFVEHLMPAVVCYETEATFTKKLKRELTWLESVSSIRELNAKNSDHLKIVIGSPQSLDDLSKRIDTDGAYIFCSIGNDSKKLDILRGSLGIKLVNPSVSDVLFHVKAMLLANEHTKYRNPRFPIILSNRSGFLELIDSIRKNETIVAKIDSVESSDAWYEFIFAGLAKHLRPIKTNSLPQSKRSKYSVVTTDDPVDMPPLSPCVVLTTSDDIVKNVRIIDLRRRASDLFSENLKHYIASARASLSSAEVPYYWGDHSSLSFDELVSKLRTSRNESNVRSRIPSDLEEFFEANKTLSLPNILEEVEYQVLCKLREKTDKVKGTVLASGIKEGTLHKKMERHTSKRQTGIEVKLHNAP